MKNKKLIAGLGLALLVVIVFFQNREEVETRILFFTVTMSRAAALGLSFAAGVAVGALVLGLSRHRKA